MHPTIAIGIGVLVILGLVMVAGMISDYNKRKNFEAIANAPEKTSPEQVDAVLAEDHPVVDELAARRAAS